MSRSSSPASDLPASPRRSRGLRRQAERTRRRDLARREQRQRLDLQQLEQRLALAITTAQNLDALVPYALISSDAGDKMFMTNLGNNVYAVADNSQFLDGGDYERHDLLEMQRVQEILVTDATFFNTTAPGNTALELAPATVQQFGLKHGGIFFADTGDDDWIPLQGDLVDGASRWQFICDASGNLTFSGPASGRPVSGKCDPGYEGYLDAFAEGVDGDPATITIDWGDGNTPENPFVENLRYFCDWPGGPPFPFFDSLMKYFPGVPDESARQDGSELFSLDPTGGSIEIVAGSVGIMPRDENADGLPDLDADGLPLNEPAVLHLDNFGDVFFKAAAVEAGPAVQMAVSRVKDGPYRYFNQTRIELDGTQIENPISKWVCLPAIDSRSGVTIAVSITLNTLTGKLNVIARELNFTNRRDFEARERQLSISEQTEIDYLGRIVNPGHISVDINYRTYGVARDADGNEVSSAFTLYDGHDVNQRLTVDLLGTASKIHIDSPVVVSPRIELRASQIRIDAPTQTVVDKLTDPAFDPDLADQKIQVTTGKMILGGSIKNPNATARFIDVNAAVAAETSYEITLEDSITQRGYLYVSPTGSLAGSLTDPATKATGLIVVDATSADIVIEGLTNADKHTYLMRSDADDINRHFLTTTSKYTGFPVGVVKGGTASVLLGNSTEALVPRPSDTTYIPTYVTLQTDLDILRVRAAHLNAVGATNPLQYEMKISEANDIVIDAIAASGLPISLSSQGAMTFKASVETRGDLTIDVAKAFTVSAPLSSLAGDVTITAGTDLVVNNSVKAGSVVNGIADPRTLTLTAGNSYTAIGKSQNGGALKINALADASEGTVVLNAFGDRSKNSVFDATVRQGTIYGTSRVRGGTLSLRADNTATLGTDVGVASGSAAAGISLTQDIDLNSYPVLAHQELTLDNLTTGLGNLAVTAGANINLNNVAAGTVAKTDGDVLISSTGIRQRTPGTLAEFVSEGTNITLSPDGVVMAINDRVRLYAPTGEIFGTSVPVASWLDWTATTVPEADGLYEGVEKLSAYLKSGDTAANLVISAPASITLEDIKTDNGDVTVTAAGAIVARKLEARGTGSAIALTTSTSGDVTVGSLAAAGRVEVKSAAGIIASLGGSSIAGLTSSAPLGEAVLRAQSDIGMAARRIVVNAAKLSVTDNDISEPQNVFITLTASKTAVDIEAGTSVDVNSSALFNDITISGVAIGQDGSVAIQATRNIEVAGSIGTADAKAKTVSLAATSGGLTWAEGGQVSSEIVSLTAMRELGDPDKFQDVFGDVETFRLARTGQGDIRANFSRQSAVTLDGVTTAGGSIFITNKIGDGDSAGADIFVTSKGITAGGGGSVTLDASDQVLSGAAGTPARGIIKADGRVSLKAGSAIDVSTAAPLLWANTTGQGSSISITATGDVRIAASSDGKAVAPGTAAGIFAGSPESGVTDGSVSLSVLGKLSTEKNAWVSAGAATILARAGISLNVDVSGPVSATTSSGSLGLTSKGSLLIGSRGLNAAGGNVSVTAASEVAAGFDPDTDRALPAISQIEMGAFGITGRAVSLKVSRAGAIDVKTSATVLNASTQDGDIWITERDNAAVGTGGIIARADGGSGKGNVYLSSRGGFTTQQVLGTAAGRVSGQNVDIEVSNLLTISTAADVLTINSLRGDVQITEDDAVTLRANVASGAVDVRAGDKLTVEEVKTNGSRAAVSLTAGPTTSGGVLQGTKEILLSLTEDPDTFEPLTPINAAGSVVTLRGSKVTQDIDSRAAVVATALSVNATGSGDAVNLIVSSNAVSASAPLGNITIQHQGAASVPLVLGAAINGVPAVIRAGGNVSISSATSDVVVAAAPTAGNTSTVSIEADADDKSVTFIVTTNADTTTGGAAVAGSLRSTLSLMNANSEDRQGIAFSNAITAPINLSRPLAAITRQTALDGTRRFIAASNQFISGAGTPIVIDGSQIRGAGEANGIEFKGSGANGSSMKGFAIQGFRTGAGVKLTDVSDVSIRGNTLGFVRSSGPVAGNKYGVHVTSSDTGGSSNNRIVSNSIGSNTAAGIFVSNIGTTNTVIQKNQIGTTNARVDRGNAGHGVHISNAGAGTVVGDLLAGDTTQTTGNGNLFMFNGSPTNKPLAAMLVDSTDGVVVKGNEFMLNDGRGLHLRDSDLASIVGNTFTRNGEDAVYIEASSAATVRGNFIGTDKFRTLGQGNAGAGLRVAAGSGHTIAGNSIANNKGAGIGLSDSSGNTIGGTTAADRNTISGNLTGIFVSNGGADSVTAILGNAISNNAVHGIEVEKTTRVEISGGNAIELNGARSVGGSGITIRNAAIATIFGNAIRGNGNTADDSRGFTADGIRREPSAVAVPTPAITSGSRGPNGTLGVSFTASGMGGSTVWVDLYQSESTGQGGRWLGRRQVTLTNGTGAVTITPIGGFTANTSIVMTVTTASNHTSSFSTARLVT